MKVNSCPAIAFSLFLAGSVYAQSPISDDFDDGLGSQWTFVTIGNGPTKDGAPSVGGVEVVNGQLHLSSNGWNVWEDQDAMAFLYQEVTGDFDVLGG